ncbi:LOW QUALITY PROTEIN: hypothetical protein ACHAW5_006699 [Stephanodiscus triporus]|uniref:NADP-dependent oxidoreductase domain-containing protein n=1 Tax=Stephanodiscus triporus TaxID=2934178 RepID=A0ABD3QN66_9STRA
MLHKEGELRHLGLSNFPPWEYEELMSVRNSISIPPIVNQFEVSPFMYRPRDVVYFQEGVLLFQISQSSGCSLANQTLREISRKQSFSPAQIMIRWGIRKSFTVACKTSSPERMAKNRGLFHFALSKEEINITDGLTTAEDVAKREQLEKERKL